MEIIYTDSEGVTTKFTEEMAITAISERDRLRKDLEWHLEDSRKRWNQITEIKTKVYEFFNEQYSSGDTELTFSIESINELLDSIGCDKLKRMFTVTGRVEFVFTDIEAGDEDEARDQVENYLTVELDGNPCDDFSVDITSVDEQ